MDSVRLHTKCIPHSSIFIFTYHRIVKLLTQRVQRACTEHRSVWRRVESAMSLFWNLLIELSIFFGAHPCNDSIRVDVHYVTFDWHVTAIVVHCSLNSVHCSQVDKMLIIICRCWFGRSKRTLNVNWNRLGFLFWTTEMERNNVFFLLCFWIFGEDSEQFVISKLIIYTVLLAVEYFRRM